METTSTTESPAPAEPTTITTNHNTNQRRHHRILVIGSTGAGKSTLINALVGHEAMDTSSDAIGCTGSYATATTERPDPNEPGIVHQYEFIDTVGVNEPTEGTVSRTAALKMFFQFLKDNKVGFNLIIFCTREGRVTEESTTTYEINV